MISLIDPNQYHRMNLYTFLNINFLQELVKCLICWHVIKENSVVEKMSKTTHYYNIVSAFIKVIFFRKPYL